MSNLKNKEKLDIVSLWELMGNTFYIPDYQRGYRWTEFEVEKLLEDLYAYIKKDKNGETFYCMQPLVVCFNESENAWEVIDGQQRLTTLFLMLSLKKQRLQEDNPGLKIFNISYKSRPDSEKFLKNIDFSKQNENIDYYHICEALKQIKSYYEPINSGKFVDSILNAKDERGNPSVKFIWYDVTEEIKSNKVSSEEIFSRLNVGKIGLTNAELIKALFLNRADKEAKLISSDEKAQSKISGTLKIKIANDWDMVEHSLQNDNFWSFIYGKNDGKYDTRIEFLFDLIKGKQEKDESNEYFTFNKYNEDFKSDEEKVSDNSVENKWKEVMDEFYLYKDWFDDKQLYHLIGYLRYKKILITEITKKHDEAKSNSEFIKGLRDWCVELALNINLNEKEDFNNNKENFVREKLKSYEYGEDNNTIRDTLLLFNVLSVLDCEKSSARFSFSDFYETNWDLEHIFSQTPKDIDDDGKTDWILTNLAYFSGIKFDFENKDNREKRKKITDYKNKIKNELSKLKKEIVIEKSDTNAITAKDICEKLLALLDSKEETTNSEIYNILIHYFDSSFFNSNSAHGIANLVLLDAGTNRGYKNAFFPVKRQLISSREKDGVYILPCTKNVFQKSYSAKLFDLMNWTNSDEKAYMEEIVKCLSKL